jgi:glycosyltransferase involved in cell wall biosynthesis
MSAKRKILIIIPSLAGGGAERVAVNLSKGLDKYGYNVVMLTVRSTEFDFYELPPAVERIALANDKYLQSTSNHIFVPFIRLIKIRSIIKEIQPQIILGMVTKANIYAILASIGLGIPVVISERNYPPRQPLGWFIRLLRKIIYRGASVIVVLTQNSGKWFKKNVPGVQVEIIPNAIAWPLSELKPRVNVKDYFSDDELVFLSVGRLHIQKGHDLLIKAFTTIIAQNHKTKLAILGEGEERKKLSDLIKREGVQENVFLVGSVGNIADWYARADVFVLSSTYEGFPNVLLEALSAGCACISFDCNDGPRELIQNGINGMLVPPEDIDSLAKAINELAKNKKIREGLSIEAIKIRETYSDDFVFRKWKTLFDLVLKNSNK